MNELADLERRFRDRNRDLSGVEKRLQKLDKKKSLTPQEQKKRLNLIKERARLEAQINCLQEQISCCEARTPVIGIGMPE